MPEHRSKIAWISLVGAVTVAIVTGLFTLVPWYFGPPKPTAKPSDQNSKPDAPTEIRDEIVAGLRGLGEISDSKRQLEKIIKLERLLELDRAIQLKNILVSRRKTIEEQIKRDDDNARKFLEAQERRNNKLIELEKARTIATAQNERDRLAREKRKVAAAAKAASAAQERARIEAVRKKRIARVQFQLQSQRLCRNKSCTSWILK